MEVREVIGEMILLFPEKYDETARWENMSTEDCQELAAKYEALIKGANDFANGIQHAMLSIRMSP